jgi:hypothetical protein
MLMVIQGKPLNLSWKYWTSSMLADPPREDPQLIKPSILFGFARSKSVFLKYSKSFGQASLPPGKTKREDFDCVAIWAKSDHSSFETPPWMEARINPIFLVALRAKRDLLSFSRRIHNYSTP